MLAKPIELGIPAQAVHGELGRILASEEFARAARMQRFLRFVVEETLAGRADGLGEYWIGVSVFDRGPDFEPALDPIVRNDARRLRGKLTEYHRKLPGSGAAVVIELPKGGYVPSFLPGNHGRKSKAGSRVAVFPFHPIGSTPESDACSQAICMSLTAGLTNVDGVEAVAHGYLREHGIRNAATTLNLSHVVNGCVWKSGDRCRLIVNLIRAACGTQVWAETYEIGAGEMLTVAPDIAARIAMEVKRQLDGTSETRPLALAA